MLPCAIRIMDRRVCTAAHALVQASDYQPVDCSQLMSNMMHSVAPLTQFFLSAGGFVEAFVLSGCVCFCVCVYQAVLPASGVNKYRHVFLAARLYRPASDLSILSFLHTLRALKHRPVCTLRHNRPPVLSPRRRAPR